MAALILAALHATKRFHQVAVNVKIAPRTRNASGFIGAWSSMNWGRNARKKSATFGLSAFVRNPCQKTGDRSLVPSERTLGTDPFVLSFGTRDLSPALRT